MLIVLETRSNFSNFLIECCTESGFSLNGDVILFCLKLSSVSTQIRSIKGSKHHGICI